VIINGERRVSEHGVVVGGSKVGKVFCIEARLSVVLSSLRSDIIGIIGWLTLQDIP
jgi:hypothetical protein